jgi:hypothetical protein
MILNNKIAIPFRIAIQFIKRNYFINSKASTSMAVIPAEVCHHLY